MTRDEAVHAADPGRLTVVFLGLSTMAVNSLGFGRNADVVIDADNQYLHGEAGRFRAEAHGWALHTTGSTLPLRLLHQTGLMVDLPPATSTRVPGGHGRVQVTAGPTTYELDYFFDTDGPSSDITRRRTGTLFYGRDLTAAQVDYAVTLAEPRLLGLRQPLRTHAEIGAIWNVSPGTVRRSFEEIRDRLRAEGVKLIDSQERLIDYLIINRVVTLEMLSAAKLHAQDGPVRRRDVLARRAI